MNSSFEIGASSVVSELDTNQLFDLAAKGDHSAQCQLLEKHRGRLKRMVAAFLDPRVAARLDPSDVLQDAMASAALRLSAYLEQRPLEFYPWLRQIVKEKLIEVHRQHVRAQRRSVAREHRQQLFVSDASAMHMAQRLVSREPSPSNQAGQREWLQQIKVAMSQLSEKERELLVMRFAEQLTISEISQVLAISEGVARRRIRRAIERLTTCVKNQ